MVLQTEALRQKKTKRVRIEMGKIGTSLVDTFGRSISQAGIPCGLAIAEPGWDRVACEKVETGRDRMDGNSAFDQEPR